MIQPTPKANDRLASPGPLLFAFAVLIAGMLPTMLMFALDPNVTTRISLDAVPIPGWVFTAVWLIAYPCMGIATWLVWRQRHRANVSVALAIFLLGFIQTLCFWFTTSVQMTAVLDAMVMLVAYTVAFVYFQFDRRTVFWLLPWLIWMPITFAVKLWVVFAA